MFVIQAASSDGKFRDTGAMNSLYQEYESEVRVPFDLSDGDDGRYMVIYYPG